MTKEELIRHVGNMKGKYIKVVLTFLESQQRVTPEIRKIVLDAFNDNARDIIKEIE